MLTFFQPQEFGPYTLLHRLATGGMAELFVAFDRGPKGPRIVVIKQILGQFSEDQEFVEMFTDECAITSALRHQNIVRVFDFGSHEGVYYLAMEYLQGAELRLLDDTARRAKDPLTLQEAVFIISQASRGLECAHDYADQQGNRLNVVHRDVTPENILISAEGQIRLVDFGIARATQRLSVTRAGMIKGKLCYLCPEQFTGKTIDHRADIFSAGIVLWQLLAGKPLFAGDSEAEVMRKVCSEPVPPPSRFNRAVPAILDMTVARALEKKPADRFQSAGEFADQLDLWLDEQQFFDGPARISARIRRFFGAELDRRAARVEEILAELGLHLPREDATSVVLLPHEPEAPALPAAPVHRPRADRAPAAPRAPKPAAPSAQAPKRPKKPALDAEHARRRKLLWVFAVTAGLAVVLTTLAFLH